MEFIPHTHRDDSDCRFHKVQEPIRAARKAAVMARFQHITLEEGSVNVDHSTFRLPLCIARQQQRTLPVHQFQNQRLIVEVAACGCILWDKPGGWMKSIEPDALEFFTS